MEGIAGARLLVTGGSSGIGLATAKIATDLGAEVTVVGRSPNRLETLDIAARRLAVDLSDYVAAEDALRTLGRFDYICHCAAPASFASPFKDLPIEKAREHFQGRFWASFYVARFAADALTDTGSIAYVVGTLSRRPMKERAIVTAAQAAVVGLAVGLAIDLAPRRVNTIVAGLTATDMWSRLEPAARDAMFTSYSSNAPAGVVGQPHQIANMILATLANPYVTGSTITVDGGATIV